MYGKRVAALLKPFMHDFGSHKRKGNVSLLAVLYQFNW